MRWKTLLPEESRKIVNECLDRILPKNWQGCGDIVESVVAAAKIHSLPEETVSDAGRDEITRFVTGAVTAAIIEKLDSPVIIEDDQAQLFAMSANLDHQVAACDWFISQCGLPIPNAGFPEVSAFPGPTIH
jgi:hypothetical protein